ncbi:MAG TPA: amino acid permease [Chitinophagales bacterium]|nr:amino acid permease [Chitinophagales bacterium]
MEHPHKPLKFLDAALIVTSGMIGSGIFIVSADMSRTLGGPGWLLVAWVISGLMTVFAALSYGELAGMFPHAGGQYVYLKEAYNPLIGFLYGWTLFAVVQSGTIAAVAVAFAKFTGVLIPQLGDGNVLWQFHSASFDFKITAAQLFGIFSILIITIINARGINYGKMVNRIFTSTKLLALFGLIVLGIFFFARPGVWQQNVAHFWDAGTYTADENGHVSFKALTSIGLLAAMGVALVGSLFSSDAWNNVTFIAGEIDEPKRNIPLSLFTGTVVVTVLYLLANVAYLKLLPFFGTPNAADIAGNGLQFPVHDRVGTAAATMIFGNAATVIMALLIMVSTFGCNNGIVLASVRVYQAMAKDGLFFSKMKDNNRFGVPGFALWVQFIWASLLCLSGKYGDLLDYIMFAVMLFYILTIIGLFILRVKRPNEPRPYKAFGYPIIPIIYIIFALYFCIDLLIMKPAYSYPGLIIVILGLPVFYYWRKNIPVSTK